MTGKNNLQLGKTEDVINISARYRSEFEALKLLDSLPEDSRRRVLAPNPNGIPIFCFLGINPFNSGTHYNDEADAKLRQLHLIDYLEVARAIRDGTAKKEVFGFYPKDHYSFLIKVEPSILQLGSVYTGAQQAIISGEKIDVKDKGFAYSLPEGNRFLFAQTMPRYRSWIQEVVVSLESLGKDLESKLPNSLRKLYKPKSQSISER